MKIHILAAAAAAGAFALSAQADTTWWSEAFELQDIVALTNTTTYTSGTWTMEEGDSSAITDIADTSYTNAPAEVTGKVLKLDTQGGNLTFTPTNATGTSTVLVDADIYFVGSDQPPSAAEFDAANDVQAAIYLKLPEEQDGGEGEPENPTLCIYAFDSSVNSRNWIELDSTVDNESWARVEIVVDYSLAEPVMQVFVNGNPAAAKADASKTSWPIANYQSIQEKKLSSISFRGTGAVDNFVGAFKEEAPSYTFSATAYVDGVESLDDEIDEVEAQVGTPASFEVPLYSAVDMKPLSKIVVKSFAIGGSDTEYAFAVSNDVWSVDPADGPFDMSYVGSGIVMVDAPTDGAEADSLLIEVYYGEAAAPAEDPDPVDPGSGFDDYFAGDPDSAPLPVEVVDDPVDGPGFTVRFIGQAGVTYQLIAVDAVDDDWSLATEVGDPVTPQAVGVVELVAPMTEDAQFYKIKASN